MEKPNKIIALFYRIFRRKKSAFAKQRRLLRGDYNIF